MPVGLLVGMQTTVRGQCTVAAAGAFSLCWHCPSWQAPCMCVDVEQLREAVHDDIPPPVQAEEKAALAKQLQKQLAEVEGRLSAQGAEVEQLHARLEVRSWSV